MSRFRTVAFGVALAALTLTAQRPEWRIGSYRGRQVTYQVVDGLAIYQGDIILGRVADLEREQSLGLRPESTFTVFTSTRVWPGGVVPYEIDPAMPNQQRVTDAVNYFSQNTPLRWQPHAGEANYVFFRRTTIGDGVCSSSVGMVGGQQFINTDDLCTANTLVHEMGHTIGFYHEQERQDRNQFVTVVYENIDKNRVGNYNLSSSEQDVGFYDFASHMHYAATSFSRDGDVTIQTVPAGIPLSEPPFFSAGDLDTLQRMYGSPPAAVTVTSNPIGLQVIVDGATVTTPQVYNWTPGSTHTLEARGPQTLAALRYQFGAWSDGGAQAHGLAASAGVTVYSVSFVRQASITFAASPTAGGTVVLDPPSADGFYAAYTNVRARAVPAAGYQFRNWAAAPGGSCGGIGGSYINPRVMRPTTISLNCLAVFTQSPMTTITSDPPGRTVIVDGTSFVAPVNMVWTVGSTHTISASTPTTPSTAPVRYIFTGWDDGGANSHSITATAPSTITARFTTQYPLAFPTLPASIGTITANPPSADGFYDAGSQVQVTYNPAPGEVLISWSGDLAGNAPSQTLVMDQQRTIGGTWGRSLPVATVVHGATFQGGAIAPGEIITIFGSGIGPPSLVGLQLDSSGKVSTNLAGTQVLFDGVPSPMVYASATQTAAIVPYAVAGKTSTALQVIYQGRTVVSATGTATSSQPGIFTANASGKGGGAIINQDGTLNSNANPAPRGSVVSLYVSGEGQTNPPGVDGQLAAVPLASPVLPVSVRVGGKPAVVQYAGGAPGLVAGVMQVNAQIPPDLLPGQQSLYLVVGTAISPLGVTIAIK